MHRERDVPERPSASRVCPVGRPSGRRSVVGPGIGRRRLDGNGPRRAVGALKARTGKTARVRVLRALWAALRAVRPVGGFGRCEAIVRVRSSAPLAPTRMGPHARTDGQTADDHVRPAGNAGNLTVPLHGDIGSRWCSFTGFRLESVVGGSCLGF